MEKGTSTTKTLCALEATRRFTTCAAKSDWIALVLPGNEKKPARIVSFGIHEWLIQAQCLERDSVRIYSRVHLLTPKISNFRRSEFCPRRDALHIQPLTFGISNAPLSPMTLKIVRMFDGARTILRLSGRIQSPNVQEIREQMKGYAETIVLDLEEITLVDLDVVRFLGVSEAEGVELVNCSPYIRDWIFRERNREERD